MTQTADFRGNDTLLYKDGVGTNDNDAVITTGETLRYDTFMLQTTAGAVDVSVSLDGTNFSTDPLSLQDLGATTNAPVTVTAPNRTYGFRGKFAKIIVSQNGATAVTGAALVCGILS